MTITQGPTNVSLVVDIADTPVTQGRGLTYRSFMPETEGVLYVYPDIIWSGFGMVDVRFPLSLAFIDDVGEERHLDHPQLEIVDIVDTEVAEDPHTGPFKSYKSAKPYRFILEVNRGFFERHNITVGAQVEYTTP